MKSSHKLFIGSLVVVALAHVSRAGSLEWAGSATGLATGSSNIWDTTTANWWDGASPVVWPAPGGTDDGAIFGGIGGAVAIDAGGVTANGLSFAVDGYTLSGGALTLNGTTPTITAADATVTTISSIISGAAGLTKAGTGSLTLSGSNNFSGVTTVSEGTLKAGNAAALGLNADGTTVAAGATLDIGGQNFGTEVVTISGAGAFGDGAIINSGVQQINAFGRLVLAADATLGGGVRWDLRNSTPTLNMAGFTLTKTGANYLGLIGATISNPGNVIVNQGELNLTFGSTFGTTGATNNVTVNSGGTLGLYQSSAVHGSTLNLTTGAILRGENGSGTQNTWAGPITVSGDVTLQADGNNTTTTYVLNLPNAISGAANLIKTGFGTVVLGGDSTISGTSLAINGGAVQMNHANAIGSISTITVSSLVAKSALILGNSITAGSGKTITIGGGGANQFYGALSAAAINTGTSDWQGNVIIGDLTGTRIGSLGGVLHISGDISETNPGSALIIRNDETLNTAVVLSGNNIYTGTTTLSAAGLRLGSASAIGTGPLLVDNATRVVSLSSTDTTPRTITGATTFNGTGVLTLGDATRNGKLAFATTINLGTAVRPLAVNSEVEFAGVVSGSLGGINKSGGGTLTLSADNDFTGATTVSAGTLKLDYSTNAGSKLSGALTLAGGTLELAGGSTTEEVASTTLSANTASTVTQSSGSSVLQMNAITRNSGAYINFAAANIATTDTSNTNGILGTWATIGGTDWAVNSTNGLDGPITALATYTQTSTALNAPANYAGVHITVNSSQTLDDAINPHSLRFDDAGAYTLTLLGTNIINSGGILVTSDVGNNLSTLTGGILTLPAAGGNLVLNQNNTANKLVIGSVITNNTGVVSLLKIGAGEAELTNTNTYTGGITVNGGTLTLSGNQATQSAPLVIGNVEGTSATLNIAGNLTLAANQTINLGLADGANAVINQTAGTVSFTTSGNQLLIGNASPGSSGTYNLSGGTLTTVNVANRGVMIGVNAGGPGKPINAAFNLSGTGVLNNAGVLQVVRGDSATPYQNATYTQTGGTSTNGTLLIGGSAANGANSSATFSVTGGTFSAAAFSNLSLGHRVSSTLTIGGTADVTLPAFPTARGTASTATLYFDGGVLKPFATSAAYLGGLSNAFIKAGGAKFNVDTGKDITVSQALLADPVATGGGLTKEGVGALILSGASTYTGATLISAGTLQVGGGGTSGSLAPASSITNNGTLAFNRTDTLTQGTNFANGISGTGGVTKLGTGTLVLSGANSYGGNTLFGTAVGTSTGVLRLANSSALGSGKLVSNNGNADTGMIELTGGIQVANNIDFFGRTSSNTAAIFRNVAGDNELSGVLTGSFNGGNYNFHSDAGTLTISNKITTSNTGRLLNLRGVGAITISGVIADGTGNIGVRTLDAGTYTLSGTNTYTRNTEVTAGTALTLASTGQLRFVPTTTGVTNAVTGAGTFTADGTFLLDLGSADSTSGNSWLLVDVTNLSETYGDNFTVNSSLGALIETSPGVWEITDTVAGKIWTFTESSGTLGVAADATDDYATWGAAYGLSTGSEGGDLDADGLTNFEEYAFGLIPNSGSSVNPITQPLDKATRQFKYTRRATPATTGVTYTYESSTTLSGTWPVFTPDSATSNNATPIEEITVTVPAGLLANPQLFLRVKAVRP